MLCDFCIPPPSVSLLSVRSAEWEKIDFDKTFSLLLIQQLRWRPVLTFANTFSFHQYHTGGGPVCSLPANFFIFPFATTTVGMHTFPKSGNKKAANLFRLTASCAAMMGGGYSVFIGKELRRFYLCYRSQSFSWSNEYSKVE